MIGHIKKFPEISNDYDSAEAPKYYYHCIVFCIDHLFVHLRDGGWFQILLSKYWEQFFPLLHGNV